MQSTPLDTGRLIGDRYVLETLIAQGGMGEVWRARHKALKSLVAIKFLHRASSFSESRRKRFLTEAQVTANLKTRHAVQVFDFGVTEDELPYLVMEYLEGETLEKRIAREGTLSIEATFGVLRQAARALDRAHALGIVHRDFKPENVIILADEEGGEHVKVVDFGIAKILGDLADLVPPSVGPSRGHETGSVTNTAVGTPYYMAPEQVQDSSKVGPAADIWAFGIVAYECLTGKRPYDDESIPMLLARLVTHERPAPASSHADLPAAFDDWFDVACAGDPEDRYPNAQAAVNALAAALDMPMMPSSPSRTSTPGPAVKRIVSPLAATLDARKSARPPKMPGPIEVISPPSDRGTPPPLSDVGRSAVPPPPLSSKSSRAIPPISETALRAPKVPTYAPIEPAPRPSRVGRPSKSSIGLALVGGAVAIAVTMIALARHPADTPTAGAKTAESALTVASAAPPPASQAASTVTPVEPAVVKATSSAAAEPAASSADPIASAASLPAGGAPGAAPRGGGPKKGAATGKPAPSAFRLPPLGL